MDPEAEPRNWTEPEVETGNLTEPVEEAEQGNWVEQVNPCCTEPSEEGRNQGVQQAGEDQGGGRALLLGLTFTHLISQHTLLSKVTNK